MKYFQVRDGSCWRLLALPAGLHVLATSAIYLIGRLQLLPSWFDVYGIGISFAIDSRFYRIEASLMATALQQGHFSEWWSFGAQPHVKIYSLAFAAFGPILGFNILSAEVFNLLYYLSILVLVYWIGRLVFTAKVGIVAAAIVAIWPSILLHTTQMLRDPLFITYFLQLILIFVVTLTFTLKPLIGVLVGLAGGIVCILLWEIRGDMWELLFVIIAAGIAVSAGHQLWSRQLSAGNTIVLLMLFFFAIMIPREIPAYRQQDSKLLAARNLESNQTAPAPPLASAEFGRAESISNTGLSKLITRISLLRHKFIANYPLAGSNIDSDVEINGIGDAFRYAPRALEIGLFSPFPNMWFTRGAQVGFAGRLLSGAEALCMYGITLLAVYSVFQNRRRFSVWFLLGSVLLGCLALGYVVSNVSTLYRMRYGFWILLIVLAAGELVKFKVGSNSEDARGNNLRPLPSNTQDVLMKPDDSRGL